MRKRLFAALALTLAGSAASGNNDAAAASRTMRLGVLTDMSGPYASAAGRGSVLAAQMAIDDCLSE